jgi:C4-type Zn-finger protein
VRVRAFVRATRRVVLMARAWADIPYFKEVVIMAFNCDNCGHRSNEVKAGGGISEKGHRFTLKVTKPEDLARDVLKVRRVTRLR